MTPSPDLAPTETPATEAYLRLLAAVIDNTRSFTMRADLIERSIQTRNGRVVLNRLADLFEGVTHTLILAGGDEGASTAAVARIRELAQRDPELSAWVDGVLARYGYNAPDERPRGQSGS